MKPPTTAPTTTGMTSTRAAVDTLMWSREGAHRAAQATALATPIERTEKSPLHAIQYRPKRSQRSRLNRNEEKMKERKNF